MKRISITKPIWFIDNSNGNIYWFRKITDDEIKGIEFPKHTYKIKNWGSWVKQDWRDTIKLSDPQRFRKVDFSRLTSKRKQNMFKGIFGWIK